MPSSVYILATLPAILIPVIAADVVTIALGSGDAATTRLGQVVGSVSTARSRYSDSVRALTQSPVVWISHILRD